MRPLRIAYLISHFPPVIGGAELQAAYLAKEFSRLGHDVTVVTRQVPGRGSHPHGEKYRVVSINTGGVSKWAAVRYVFGGWRALRCCGPFDIVQTSQLGSAALLGLLWQRYTGTPTIVKAEGSEVPTGFFSCLHPRNLFARYASGIIAVAPHLEMKLQPLRGPGTQLTRIENAVPDLSCSETGGIIENIPEAGRRQRQLTFIFVGRMERIKGPDVLVKAWRAMPALHRHHQLVMVGAGSEQERLRAETRDVPGIRWTGQTTDVSTLLCDADVYVNSSRDEGLSLALLEALSAGLPVVASDLPGTRHALTHDGLTAGWLVPPGDVTRLADAMQQLALVPDLRHDFARGARQIYERRYRIDRTAARYLDFYREVIFTSTPGGPQGV